MMKVVMDGSSQEMVARFRLTYILFPRPHASSTPPVCGGPLGSSLHATKALHYS